MAKETYNSSIECPKCKQSGVLKVTENDYPFMRKLDRSVTCAEGDFDASMIDDSNAKIRCKICGEIFKW